MRTILIATLLCVAIAQSYAAEYVCYSTVCVGLNAACAPDTANGNYPSCNYGLFCNSTDTANVVCSNRIAIGGDCGFTGCAEGATCEGGKCVAVRNSPGKACSQDSQCLQYADDGTTTSSTCVSGRCAARANGAACTNFMTNPFASQCGQNSYCNGTICLAATAVGQNCSTSECVDGATCRNEICVAEYTVPLNGDCDGTDSCVAGLVCGQASKCVNPTALRNNIVCTKDSDCQDAESCDCQGVKAEQQTCRPMTSNSAGYITAIKAYETCLANDFACSNNFDSCSACDNQACDLYKVAPERAATQCSFGPRTKDLVSRCQAQSSSASTVAISAAVGVAAVIALF